MSSFVDFLMVGREFCDGIGWGGEVGRWGSGSESEVGPQLLSGRASRAARRRGFANATLPARNAFWNECTTS